MSHDSADQESEQGSAGWLFCAAWCQWRSLSVDHLENGLAWRVPVSDTYLYDWRLGRDGREGWFRLGVLAEMPAHGLGTWQPPESQISRTVARNNWRSRSKVQGMSLPSS